jgi:nucleoporin NUP42
MTAGQGRPQWILSTYGPGRAPPASLLEDNEYSFEELRLRFYELASAGNEAQANQEAGALWSKAEDGMRAIARNPEDVIKFMEDANQKHPNRYDFCQTDGSKTREELAKAAESANSGFGGGFGQAASTTGFGKPSFGQPPAAAATGFGQPSFGQPSQPTQSANPFAQPSAATAFGQPSQVATGGFGQPTPPSSFGAPSFGQPAQSAPGFGQPSQTAPDFGQPSQPGPAFGQPSQPAPAFGQPAQSANPFAKPSVGFGQPSAPGGFGQTGFGQPSQPVSTGFGQPSQPALGGFGQPSQPALGGFGQPSQPATTGFGQPAQPTSTGFGQPSQSATTGFGTGTAFGTKSSNSSPSIQPAAATATGGFGQPSNTIASAPGIGADPSTSFAPAPNAQAGQNLNPLTGQPSASLHYTETLSNRAAKFRPGTKEVQSYAGRRVQYVNDVPCYERPDGKGWERIWFPEFGNGAEVLALNAPGKKDDLEGKADDYTQAVKEAYIQLLTKGEFGDAGMMPTVPPMREWCSFDF